MAEKERFELEFPLNSSQRILYERIGTAEGLAEWFADNVNVEGDRFIFTWEGVQETAILEDHKEGEYIRFRWESEEEVYFQLWIVTDEITGDCTLRITDHAEPEDLEASKELWNSQVEELRHLLGA